MKLSDLEDQYKAGTLPDQLAFEYISNGEIRYIHKDELAKSVILKNLYSTPSMDKFLTMKTK